MPFTYHSKQIVTTVQFYKFSELIAGCPKDVQEKLKLIKAEWFKHHIITHPNWSVIQRLNEFGDYASAFPVPKKQLNEILKWYDTITKQCSCYVDVDFSL